MILTLSTALVVVALCWTFAHAQNASKVQLWPAVALICLVLGLLFLGR